MTSLVVRLRRLFSRPSTSSYRVVRRWIAPRLEELEERVNPSTGIITTVAGGGTNPSPSFTGPATAALLGFPEGLALDAQGNLFIADTHNSRPRGQPLHRDHHHRGRHWHTRLQW
jgi:NHL repeat